MYDDRSSFYNWEIDVLLGWIGAVGADRSTLGSDLGQMKNPLPSEAFTNIVGQLLDAGLARPRSRRWCAETRPGSWISRTEGALS